jgi:hypothetical protein
VPFFGKVRIDNSQIILIGGFRHFFSLKLIFDIGAASVNYDEIRGGNNISNMR